ncbi:MAG TPA: ankyrin repeat domain-containing protein [Pyrinomonadaceae bacterium]|nr:ankyrin repeat domain-containing protein [Pyrinomonadaceae bacterium]
MSDLQLIDAVKTGQPAKVEEALNAGADIHQQDEQGWTPLNWAAGKGSVEIVNLLLNRGADVFRTGRDQRTPYKIALAAKHTDVARLLKQAEQAVNGASADSTSRDYARAYLLGELRKFSDWSEETVHADENGNSRELSDDDVVFLQQDFTVTELIWPGENVIFDRVTPEWIEFCTQELQFKVPDDFDLIASTTAAKAAEAS